MTLANQLPLLMIVKRGWSGFPVRRAVYESLALASEVSGAATATKIFCDRRPSYVHKNEKARGLFSRNANGQKIHHFSCVPPVYRHFTRKSSASQGKSQGASQGE